MLNCCGGCAVAEHIGRSQHLTMCGIRWTANIFGQFRPISFGSPSFCIAALLRVLQACRPDRWWLRHRLHTLSSAATAPLFCFQLFRIDILKPLLENTCKLLFFFTNRYTITPISSVGPYHGPTFRSLSCCCCALWPIANASSFFSYSCYRLSLSVSDTHTQKNNLAKRKFDASRGVNQREAHSLSSTTSCKHIPSSK